MLTLHGLNKALDLKLNKVFDKKLKPIHDDIKIIKKDVNVLQKDVTVVKRDVKKLKEDVGGVIKMADTGLLNVQKRVKKVEKHLGFPEADFA